MMRIVHDMPPAQVVFGDPRLGIDRDVWHDMGFGIGNERDTLMPSEQSIIYGRIAGAGCAEDGVGWWKDDLSG